MLKEFPRIRQDAGSYRRLFSDDSYDLYVWYDEGRTRITGFQLLYFENGEQKVYTWVKGKGSDHMGVDDWDSSRFNKTPLLVVDGIPNYGRLFSEMTKELSGVEEEIRALVLDVLERECCSSSIRS